MKELIILEQILLNRPATSSEHNQAMAHISAVSKKIAELQNKVNELQSKIDEGQKVADKINEQMKKNG